MGRGPYAAQHMSEGGAIDGGGTGSESLFSEIIGRGVQMGMGTIAGLGYGLPMSRLYARYFGGSLDFKSLDGWGVFPSFFPLRTRIHRVVPQGATSTSNFAASTMEETLRFSLAVQVIAQHIKRTLIIGRGSINERDNI